eukprot:TRINITY_DN75163_c0_g1_i1.p1 TRINITY_DN75163_c0_g1~~TRINITY_DN75163_c0_g1_i1.p1  ORF type:complete len:380 (+),score=57.49 TRINITY_DN75163_c0_g1_i1:128-1267(+)
MASPGLPRCFHRIQSLAKQQSHTITLGQLMRTTNSDRQSLIRQGRWLQHALPIRYARRLDEFLQLPHVVVHNRHFYQVLQIYLETFEVVSDFPAILTRGDEDQFCRLVHEQLEKQGPVARLLAEGYREVRDDYPHIRLDDFLDHFFTARVSTRILTENYILMRAPRDGFTGVVQHELSPLEVTSDISQQILRLTKGIYGVAPEVEFRGNLGCTLDYIPRHLSFMAQELLKNAVRATTERHRKAAGHIPSVVVDIQKGDVHVIIKISDQGGGMPKRIQQEAWEYGWSTANDDQENSDDMDPYGCAVPKKELAGFGFGLPLTRLHAQYFGGDVFMQALPGHGTDMYLLLNHLKEGTASTEEEDPSTALTQNENLRGSANAP